MADAFIKLYKKMLEWEWYDDNNTKIVFLHCLLKANWKSGSWHGISYDPGQFITSLPSLAAETHLSVQQVRTAIEHLKSTGEITDFRQSNCRVITVNNWDAYQGDNRRSNRPSTDLQQTSNRPSTVDKEYKEIKEDKEGKELKNIYGEYKHVKLTQKEFDRLVNDFGELQTLEAIKFLDEYIQEKPSYKSKDHNLAMRRWVFDAVAERKAKKKTSQETNVFEAWAKA